MKAPILTEDQLIGKVHRTWLRYTDEQCLGCLRVTCEAQVEDCHLHYMGVVEKAIDATLAAVRKNYRGVSWLYHQEKWQKMRDGLVSRFLEEHGKDED